MSLPTGVAWNHRADHFFFFVLQKKRGVDHGPEAVRNAGLVGKLSSMGKWEGRDEGSEFSVSGSCLTPPPPSRSYMIHHESTV